MNLEKVAPTTETQRHREHCDILIIGGGPVGAALALALRGSGLTVQGVEAREAPGDVSDPRALALSYGSKLILQRLGVWQCLAAATPIETIHVSSRGSLGRSVISSGDAGVPALGYVVNYHDLYRVLHDALQSSGIPCLRGAAVTAIHTASGQGGADIEHRGTVQQFTAELLALADGGRLVERIEGVTQRVKDYHQWAVVAQVQSRLPHRNVAYERFTPDGPMALLPNGEGFALVWTTSPQKAQELLQLDDAAFLARLHGDFGDRAGGFISAGRRAGFALALKYSDPTTAERMVLIGNAAQTLHPVAGQGFNLGLRDAWELADEILKTPRHEIGAAAMLERYRRRRMLDATGGIWFTDSLIRVFSNSDAVLNVFRGTGLAALDLAFPLKRFLARRMIFGVKG